MCECVLLGCAGISPRGLGTVMAFGLGSKPSAVCLWIGPQVGSLSTHRSAMSAMHGHSVNVALHRLINLISPRQSDPRHPQQAYLRLVTIACPIARCVLCTI